MQLTNCYSISSDDIKEFELSTDKDTVKWLNIFKEFNPYDVSEEQSKKLSAQIEVVKELVPNTEGKSRRFREWRIDNLVYASRADLGKVPPATSMYAHGILIARMVLAYYLVKGQKQLNNGQTIAQQVQALGFTVEEK